MALVVGLVTLFAQNRAANSATAIYQNNVTNVGQAGQIQAAFARARLDLATAAIAPDSATSDKYTNAYTAYRATVDQAAAAYRIGTLAGDPAVVDDLTSNLTLSNRSPSRNNPRAAANNDSAMVTKINEEGIAPIAAKISADVRALRATEASGRIKGRRGDPGPAPHPAAPCPSFCSLSVYCLRSASACWWPARSCGR